MKIVYYTWKREKEKWGAKVERERESFSVGLLFRLKMAKEKAKAERRSTKSEMMRKMMVWGWWRIFILFVDGDVG